MFLRGKPAVRGDLQRRMEGGITTQDVVGLNLTVTQVDYNELKMDDSLRVSLDLALTKAIAAAAFKPEIEKEDVVASCSADVTDVSIKVQATVTPPPGMQASETMAAIKAGIAKKNPSFAEGLAKAISAIPGITSVSKGTIAVSSVSTPTVMPIIYPKITIDKKEKIPNGVFTLFESLHALDDARVFNAANTDELVPEEILWSMKKLTEVFKDQRLERLFIWVVSNLQKKDRRSCNNWASSVPPNTLQYIMAESPAKEEICGRSSNFPRDKLIAYCNDCLVSVAMAIVGADILGHWTYDFNPQDQAFLGEAVEKLTAWPEVNVSLAQGLWDRNAVRFILAEHAANNVSISDSMGHVQRTPKDIICGSFKAGWKGDGAEASFFHLYPTFTAKNEKDAAESLVESIAQADVFTSGDTTNAMSAFLKDMEVPIKSKRELLLSYVSTSRKVELGPPPNTDTSPKKCTIFKKPAPKEEAEMSAAPKATRDLEIMGLDAILTTFRKRKQVAATKEKTEGEAPETHTDLAELLEAVLLLSSGDGLGNWARQKMNEDINSATDMKTFMRTVAVGHIAGSMREAAGTGKKVNYDDKRAQELVEGTRLWTQDTAVPQPSKKKGATSKYKPDDLGQMLRMFFKLDLAMDGGSIPDFLRALNQGEDLMGSVFTKLAPRGSHLRLAICQDVKEFLGSNVTLPEEEIDTLVCHSGFFDINFQTFLKADGALDEARSYFDGAGITKASKAMGLSALLEAVVKIMGMEGGLADMQVEDVVLDVCDACVSCPTTWRLFGKIITAVKNGKFTHESEDYDLGDFVDQAKEMSKTGRLLAYKLAGGVAKSLQTDVEKVIENFLNNVTPKDWVKNIKSLDTVIFLLEYMGKEDIKLAYERFDHEMKTTQHNELKDLVACVKSIYSAPLATSQDLDVGEAIKKKKTMMKSPVTWRGIQFKPEDWGMVIDIVGAAADMMKQRYSVIMLPHHTQLIALLMCGFRVCGAKDRTETSDLPRTMLARVGTGEGKSIVIGMLAAFVAKKGMRAHVINNDRVLTRRDYEGNKSIFAALGLKASADQADIRSKEMQVVYCCPEDIESACLESLMEGSAEDYEQGLEDAVLIVDEVDGLIFDRGTYSSKFFGDREFSDHVNEWLSQLMMYGKIQKDWDDFRGGDEWTRALQKEVEEAFKESETKVEGVDFTKRGDRMYMLDPKTKMIREQDWALWLEILKSQRNHPAQWIEYKYEKAILSSLQCFMSYSCLFGLTGSLGQQAEKKYLAEHYEATAFNVPPFLDTCRTGDGKGIQGKKTAEQISKGDPFTSQADVDQAILDLATAKCTEVPVLVITKDPDTVRNLSKQLREKLAELYGARVAEDDEEEVPQDEVIELLHNPRNPKEFVELVIKSTEQLEAIENEEEEDEDKEKQVWRITVTTAEGGRGHDYRVVDPAIDEKGGLLLILTFVPWSEREWIQFLGRTGRQDHHGQYAVFLCTQDESIQQALGDKGPQESLVDAVLRHGDERTAKFLAGTKEEINKGRIMHQYTMRYWALHKQDKTTSKQNWQWKGLCKDFPKLPMKDLQDRFHQIFPHEKKVSLKEINAKPPPPGAATAPAAAGGSAKGGGGGGGAAGVKKEDLLQSTDGQRYKGDLVNGKPHGYGVFKTADGARYEGQWDQGQRSGKGKYVDASGATYEGQWKEHDKSGKGIECYPDKAKYEGDFQKGCKHGVGKYTTSTGATYDGQFVKDKYDGEGCYDFTSGRKYIGQWKRGQMEGTGKMVWANGVSYEGSYEQDVRHGEGIVRWPDGRVYQGHWHKGRLVGSGVMLDKDGAQKLLL